MRRWLDQLGFHLRTLFQRRKLDEQLSAEIQTHVDLATEANIARGMAPEDARHAALREFGNVAGIQERARDEHGWVWLEQLGQDARHAIRSLARTPAFALSVWGTLVVGIGLAGVMVGLTAPNLFAPNSEGLYLIGTKDKKSPFTPYRAGLHWEAYREQTTAFSAFGAVYRESTNVLIQGRPVIATVMRASNDCFSTLGIQPVLGRTFLPEEHRRGASGQVVILAGHFWRRHFNSDPDILGREITIGQQSCTVIGVFRADTAFPSLFAGDVYLPLAFRADPQNPMMPMLQIVGRLRPGVTVAQAEAELGAVKLPELPVWAANFFAEQQTVLQKPGDVNRPEVQWLVLIAALLLYVLAALNATNLMLVRLLRRRQEVGIRLALGGTRWRVGRVLLMEGLGLAVLAGLTVLLTTRWVFPPLFVAITQQQELGFISYWNGPVTGSIVGLSLLSGLALVLVTLRSLHRGEMPARLKETSQVLGGSRGLTRMRSLLVMLQSTFAVILLAGTGLMVKSFDKIHHVDLGFDPVGRVKVQLALPPGPPIKPEAHLQWFQRIAARLEKLPGVQSVAIGQDALLVGNFWGTAQLQMPDGSTQPAAGNFVAENFLETSGMTLTRGRWLKDSSGYEVVINESLAKARFGDEDPVGKSIRLVVSGNHDIPIVGVVKDVRETIRSSGGIRFYTLARLYPPNINTLLVRMNRDPGEEFTGLVRQVIYEEEPGIVVHTVKSIHDVVDNLMWAERNALAALKTLSLVALIMAVVGVFSVLAFAVDSRTKEFGVRMALGARPVDLSRLVLRGGLTVVGAGILLGVAGALGLTRFMQSLLFETTPNDPAVYASVTIVLLGAATLACWLPARRAAKVDPVIALRAE